MRFISLILIALIFAGCATQPQKPVTKNISLLFNKAYKMMEKNPDGAILLFDEAIKTEPKMWQAHYNKAIIYVNSEKLKEAEEAFLKALKYFRKNPNIANALGNLYIKTGRYEEAGKFFKKAVDYDKSGTSMMNLANFYQTIGEEEKAFKYYTQINKKLPKTPFFHYNFAIHYLAKGDYIEALAELKKSTGYEKREFKALLLETQILVKMGKIEPALSLLLNIRNQYPKEPDSYKHLGIIYEIYLADMEKALFNYSKYKRLEKKVDHKTVQAWIDVAKAKLDLLEN